MEEEQKNANEQAQSEDTQEDTSTSDETESYTSDGSDSRWEDFRAWCDGESIDEDGN